MGQVSPHSRRLGLAFGSETVNQVGRSLRERLEGELAGELHDARIAIAGDLAEGARGRCSAHRLHIGMVGCVERLHAELEVQPFIDAEVSVEAQVQNVESRPFDGTALGRARNDAGGRLRGEGPRVKPRGIGALIQLVVQLDAVAAVGVSDLVYTEPGVGVAQHAEAGVIVYNPAICGTVDNAINAAGQVVVDVRTRTGKHN